MTDVQIFVVCVACLWLGFWIGRAYEYCRPTARPTDQQEGE